jgi:fructokinase
MDVQIVGIGEVLWDLLPTGPQLGGAPANFAYHAHALGARASVISRVGNGDHGREILRRLRGMGLPETTVQIDQTAPTGTATVALSSDGLAHFTIQQDVAWDYIARSAEAITTIRTANAICFGSLAQRSELSRRTVQKLVAEAPRDALRVFDINLRQKFYTHDVLEQSLHAANVLKLNEDELLVLAELLHLAGSDESRLEQLARTFHLQVVALTRGANGSLLYQEGRWSNCSSRPVKVVDTVGAGDSFTAAMVMGLLRKMGLDEINQIANEIARYVCSQPGATPDLPVEFARRFSAAPPPHTCG